MKTTFFTILLLATTLVSKAQLYRTDTAHVDFFSSTPLENIEAHSREGKAIMNVNTKEVAFLVSNTSFHFKNGLMEEHFNEKYMQSEKYPQSSFKGKINENVDLSQDGTYSVSITGKLNIHGVEKDRTLNGTFVVKNGEISFHSKFEVGVKDHNIEVPQVVGAKIAERISVNILALMLPKK